MGPSPSSAVLNSQWESEEETRPGQWFQEFVARSWAPLSQVVKLGEVKDGLALGRVRVNARFMRERAVVDRGNDT